MKMKPFRGSGPLYLVMFRRIQLVGGASLNMMLLFGRIDCGA